MVGFPLKGVVPPLVTPLSGRDEIDLPALERIIEHVLGGGVHGLFLLGTTGEGPSLSPAAQRTLVSEATQLVFTSPVAGRASCQSGLNRTRGMPGRQRMRVHVSFCVSAIV